MLAQGADRLAEVGLVAAGDLEVVEYRQPEEEVVVVGCWRPLLSSRSSLAELLPLLQCRPCSKQHRRYGTSSHTLRAT